MQGNQAKQRIAKKGIQMTEENTQENATSEAGEAAQTQQTQTQQYDFTELTDIDGTYQVSEIATVLGKIPTLEGYDESIPVVSNFSADNLPEQNERVIVVKTSSKKGVEGTSIISVWAIPTLDEIAKLDAGWIEDEVYSKLATKLTNSALRSDAPMSLSYPRSVNDFITSRRGGGTSKKVFNAICKYIITTLKKAGVKITKSELVDALQSTDYAKDRFATVEERGYFVKFLEAAVAMAKKKGESGSDFMHYLETRDDVVLDTVDDVDLDAISFDIDLG